MVHNSIAKLKIYGKMLRKLRGGLEFYCRSITGENVCLNLWPIPLKGFDESPTQVG